MSCFNDIAVGVTTDFDCVDLESRFQMWGLYLWLRIYRNYVRLLCRKQGDENDLSLPISYHPYYTQQSFQVGKREIDVCISVGKNLTCEHIEKIREQGTIFKSNAKVIAYGAEQVTKSVKESWKSKKEAYDISFYDAVFPVDPNKKEEFDSYAVNESKVLLNPYLLAESTHYGNAAEPQKIMKLPYVMVYASEMDRATANRIISFARKNNLRLVMNEEIKEFATPYTKIYNTSQLDVFYGILMGANHVVTDSAVVSGLTLERMTPFTMLPGTEEKLERFANKYGMQGLYNYFPVTKKQQVKVLEIMKLAVRTLNRERYRTYRILEDELNLVRFVEAPTNIRMVDCYGCSVCRDICPKGAITMEKNEEGFYYPRVNPGMCVNCGFCEEYCIANKNKHYARNRVKKNGGFPQARIAVAKAKEQQETSTSGGAFQSFARYFIEEKKGVVFGAAFNKDARVVSSMADTMKKAQRFSGSKYVKSDFAYLFPKVKECLEAGREVLYSGLPCENAALRAYLRKDYPNLTQCEVICHGGASPKVYLAYIKQMGKKYKAKVKSVNFRDKRVSWKQKDFCFTLNFEGRAPVSVRGREDDYMNAFLKDYLFRMSCYRCQYAGRNRVADITIGDYHGPAKAIGKLYTDRGVSSVIINTEKGEVLWEAVKDDFNFIETTTKQAYLKNHTRPSILTEERAIIMSKLDKMPIDTLLARYNKKDAKLERKEFGDAED